MTDMQGRDERASPGESRSRSDAGPATVSDRARRRNRFLIIHNPIAGRNLIDLASKVVRCLEQAGAVADLICLEGREPERVVLAELDKYDALIASGGDGTARSIVAMVRGRGIPFGLIPAGTGNVLAEELRLPHGAAAIAEMLLDGPVLDLSIGSVNGAPLLLMLGAGFDGQVVARLPLGLKRKIGKPAFGWPVMVALAKRPHVFPVTIDGAAHSASWLIVANASRYGGRFVLSERTNVLMPGFNIVISHARSRRERLLELLNLAAGRLDKSGTIEMFPGHEIEFSGAGRTAVQVDGEVVAGSSFRIVADAARVPMIVPKHFRKEG